jgi:hypothetical protein
MISVLGRCNVETPSLIQETVDVQSSRPLILQTLQTLFEPGEIPEVRVLFKDKHFEFGYADNLESLATDLAVHDNDSVTGLWLMVNPAEPHLLKRAPNLIRSGVSTASNMAILKRNWLVIDVDPVRTNGESDCCSTDEEKQASLTQITEVMGHLKELGWPEPVFADSGNGYHALYRIDLPNDPIAMDNLKYCLETLYTCFLTDTAHIDKSMYTANHSTRCYGSWNRKGPNTPERPWRQSKLLKIPARIVAVHPQKIADLAAVAMSASTKKRRAFVSTEADADDVEEFCELYDICIEGTEVKNKGTAKEATYFYLNPCPMADTRHRGDRRKSALILGETFGFHCFSDDCCGSIGDLMKKLHEDTGKRIPDDLFKRFFPSSDDAELLADVPFDLDEDDHEEPEEPLTADRLMQVLGATEGAMEPSVVEAEESCEEPAEPTLPLDPEPAIPTPAAATTLPTDDFVKPLLSIIFASPSDVFGDFVQYRLRLNWCANTGLKGLENTVPRSVLAQLMRYESIHVGKLPSKVELLDLVETDPVNKNFERKNDVKKYIKSVGALDPGFTFDNVVARLLTFAQLHYEKTNTKAAYKKLMNDGDIQAFRAAIRDMWTDGITAEINNANKGAVQEHGEALKKAFHDYLTGTNDGPLDWKSGFHSIDACISHSQERLMAVIGPNNNFKTTIMMSLMMNLARQGKNILFVTGEHETDHIEQSLALVHGRLSQPTYRLPSINKWRAGQATTRDLENVNKAIDDLSLRINCPGYIDVKKVSYFNHSLDEIVAYMEVNHAKYQYNALFIDPFDSLLDPVKADFGKVFPLQEKITGQMLDLKVNYRDGSGLMIVTTAQMKKAVKGNIEKLQADSRSRLSDYEDELQASNIDSYSGIAKKFDMLWGGCLACLSKRRYGRHHLRPHPLQRARFSTFCVQRRSPLPPRL